MALTDVFLNTTNPDGYSLLSDKTSVQDLTEDQLLSSDTKPSDMLADNTFDKDQFEELPISLDTDKDTSTALQVRSIYYSYYIVVLTENNFWLGLVFTYI